MIKVVDNEQKTIDFNKINLDTPVIAVYKHESTRSNEENGWYYVIYSDQLWCIENHVEKGATKFDTFAELFNHHKENFDFFVINI